MIKVVLVAGELSGDTLGAGLIHQLQALLPEIEFYGIGGPKMQAAGLQSWYPMDALSVMGISAVLPQLPKLLSIRSGIVKRAKQLPADIFVGIDAPDFNLGLAKRLKPLGIKTIQYVSPSVWAWRSGRLKSIQQSLDLMLVLFPFEQHLYQQANVMAVCVGHPLADKIAIERQQKAARDSHHIPHNQMLLALLPGSRRSEIHYNLPVQLQAVQQLMSEKPELVCRIPVADPSLREMIEQQIQVLDADVRANIHLVSGQAGEILAAADMALITSGTATLEAMLHKCPMVVTYRWSRLSHWLIAPWIKTRFVALPNILAGKKIVPEFVQSACQTSDVVEALATLLQANRRVLLQEIFTSMHQSLKKDADLSAARAVAALFNRDPLAPHKQGVGTQKPKANCRVTTTV